MSSFAAFVENLDFKSSLPPLPRDIPLDLVVESRMHTSLLGSVVRSFETAGKAQDYQKLEHIGDKIIGAATTMLLFNEHPLLTCGATTTISGLVVCNKTLSAICRAYNLQKQLRADPVQIVSLRNNSKIQGDLVEALIGSVYVHSGTQPALDFATTILRPIIKRGYEETRGSNQQRSSIASPSSMVVYGSYDAFDFDAGGYGNFEEYGPGDMMLLEEWKMRKGSWGRRVVFTKGPSHGTPNEPLHSGSLTIEYDGISRVFGPVQGSRGQKYKVVQQMLAHTACEHLGLA